MRKLLIVFGIILSCTTIHAQQSIQDQFSFNVKNHGVAASEYTADHQIKQVILLTPFQAGHYKGDYIVGQDDGIINNSVNTESIAGSFGIHVHVISFIRNLATDSTLFDGLDATPRVSWDTDVHKIVYSYMVGFTHSFQ